MKKFMKALAVTTAASTMLLASSAFAAEKIAVVNMQEVMAKIPQTAALQQTLPQLVETQLKDHKAELAQLEEDIKYHQQKLKRDKSIMSQKEIEELEKKVKSDFDTFQRKGQAYNRAIQQLQSTEQNKVLALVVQAVNNIAAAEKYDFVAPSSSFIYAKPDASITDKVIEQVSKLN